MRLRYWLWLAISLWTSSGLAQDWARAMFGHTEHDFGVVGRGANVEHRFRFENLYVEDVHVAGVQSTCGCTIPQVTKSLLKTRETAEIVATLDTKKFLGHKEATVKVIFDRPFRAEVQLHVTSVIRGDVVFEPGAVRFGSIPQGERVRQQVTVSYAGRPDWKIVDIQSNSPFLDATIRELGRSPAQVTYQVGIGLKPTAPVGTLKDHVYVVTNDPSAESAKILLNVEAIVTPPANSVTARPSPFSLGPISLGQSVTRPLVVKGESPLRILEVAASDPRIRATRPNDAKKVHVLPVTVSASGSAGELNATLRITTDAPGFEKLEVPVKGFLVGGDTKEKPVEKPVAVPGPVSPPNATPGPLPP